MTWLAISQMVGFTACLVGYNQIIRRLRALEDKALANESYDQAMTREHGPDLTRER